MAARGELRWLPDIAWWPPIIILTGVFVAVVAVVAVATRPSHDRWTSLARAVSGIILVVLTANFVRAIDDLTTHPGRSERAVIVITSLVAFAAISALCARGWRGHPGGFAALAGAAMLITGLLGSGTFGELSAPQLDTSLPDWLRRWTIAATFTVVTPSLLAAVLAGRWVAQTQSSADPTTPPAVATPPSIPASLP